MGLFSKLFEKQESPSITKLNKAIDELYEDLQNTRQPVSACNAFEEFIRPYIETFINRNKEKFCEIYDKRTSEIKKWLYITANNKAGDLLETGQYNMRSLLLPDGEGLMTIFETTIRKLIEMGIADENGTPADMSFAEERISELKAILSHVG